MPTKAEIDRIMDLRAISVLSADAAFSLSPNHERKTYEGIYTLPHISASAFFTDAPQHVGGCVMLATIGHNSKLSREELEFAFKERTREQRIKENTPFDLRWQWEVWLSGLPATAKLVAFAIRIYGNSDGSRSHPSLDILEQLTGLSRRCIQDNLKLIERGFVRKESGKGRAANIYSLVIPGETINELAKVIDMRSRATIAPLDDRSGATSAFLDDSVVGQPLPHKPVVGQMLDRSRATAAPHITRDITKKEKKGDGPPFAKIASAVAAGITASITPAAAAPPHPSEQVLHAPAECWQTPKAQMAAATSVEEATAQRHIWLTPLGSVEISRAFREEMTKVFPLVDPAAALAAAAPNVRSDKGAVNCLANARRQFGFMQQDAGDRERRFALRQNSGQPDWRDEDRERRQQLREALEKAKEKYSEQPA